MISYNICIWKKMYHLILITFGIDFSFNYNFFTDLRDEIFFYIQVKKCNNVKVTCNQMHIDAKPSAKRNSADIYLNY